MTPPTTPHSTRSRPRRTSLAVAASMTGLLVLSHPGAATAAEKARSDGDVTTTVLHPTITGTDGSVRYSVAGLAGGGVQVSFVYVPDQAAGEQSGRDEAQSKEFTVTVDAKAIATQTVTDDGGAIVPATASSDDTGQADDESDESDEAEDQADSDKPDATTATTGAVVDQEVSKDATEVTLQATTEGVQTVWVLPEQAPVAADPDDQSWVTRTWHLLVDKITGSDTDNSEDSSESADQDGKDEQDSGDDEGTPTAAPTSSPSSSTETTDEDTCDVTQDAQLTTSVEDNTVDAPLEDGPSAAPTFSEEVRKKAAQQASDCGESSGSDGEDQVEEQAGEEGQDEGDATSAPAISGKGEVEVEAGDWLSGISGERPAIEKLRGVPAEVATTWADFSGNADQLNPGAEFGPDTWNKSLIIAIPPFPEGSSWEATAAGDNDEYLHHYFSTLESKWAERDGTAYVEYSYEANGYWMAWPVKAGQEDAWAKAFERARSIQQEEFPDSLLGVRFNHESNGYDGDSHDLLQAIKGSIDFVGTSYYNAYPPVSTQAEFDERAQMLDGGGGPKGIATWLAAAKEAGLPIEFAEWAESAKDGDSAAFIDGMHDTFSSNAGPGPGQVFAESYFNIDKDNDNWRINSGQLPESAKRYAEKFADVR